MNSCWVLLALLCAFLSAGPRIEADTEQKASPLIIGETFMVESRRLKEPRRINVYLPAAYAQSPNLRFPVLYMPDGGIGEDFLHVAGLLQVLAGNQTMRPFILIGIENTERRRDMTGPTENPEDQKIAPRVGGSANFRAFIRDELMPQVASRYRTTAEKAIVGESLAGLFVVETLLLEPDLFDTYIAFDPSLQWNRQKLVSEAAGRLRGLKSAKLFYFARGGDGYTEIMEKFAETLTKAAPPNLQWHYERMPEEQHATIYHPAALKAFRALFKPPADR